MRERRNGNVLNERFFNNMVKQKLISFRNLMESNLPAGMFHKIKQIYQSIKTPYYCIMYKGNNVLCPCCGKRFRSFVPYALDDRCEIWGTDDRNVYCPLCQSAVRHRVLCDYFNNNNVFQSLSKKDILLFAPEKSIMTWMRSNHVEATTTDLLARDVDFQMDIQDMDFSNNTISVIICNQVLEHVDSYSRALEELYRVLAPGGICFLTVPILESLESTYEDASIILPEERLQHFGQIDHLRIFGQDFDKVLESYNFDVTVIDGNDCAPEICTNLVGPVKFNSLKVFMCIKR